MRTQFRISEPFKKIFFDCAEDFECNSPVKPERFIRTMLDNQGAVAGITGKGLDEEGLERKNPVIVALGDSVTAGHFESLLPNEPEGIQAFLQSMSDPAAQGRQVDIEITDARESYIEKFRLALIDLFERTSVSVINAGIAGDNLVSMAKRTQRDVIRYQPDLVLINGSLNWSEELGSAEDYEQLLREVVRWIKRETAADIILLTPNGDVKNDSPLLTMMGIPSPEPTTSERVRAIRKVAVEEKVCLADVYAVWEMARERGCPWKELLSNGVNHPGIEGHEVYAKVLMKLFE